MAGYVTPAAEIRGRRFEWGSRTFIMGIVNLSPESFSGDGQTDVESAVAQAVRFEAEGADIIDIGGMSTRPGLDEISPRVEIDRVVPAVREIVSAVQLPVSVDTYRSEVAAAALRAGANIVNDVMGLRRDPAMPRLVAAWHVPAIVMHNQRGREFHDVIADIREGFEESLSLAADAEVRNEQLILDPGFGFGWTIEQNLEMLLRLRELTDLGLPILVGTSRKSTIGAFLDAPQDDRLLGTAATVAISIANGADLVRVHDVAEMAQVARITDAIYRRRG